MSELRRFLAAVGSSTTPILVATDFDGTISEIAPRPELALLGDRARAILTKLARSPRVRVAVISGRTLVDLRERLRGIGPIWIGAEHGSLLVDGENELHRGLGGLEDDRLERLLLRAKEIASVFPGARVEPKQTGVALHHREVDRSRHQRLVEMFRLACASHRVTLLEGRMVVEGRRRGAGKELALAQILGELPADTVFVYAGDDRTDEPALSLASTAENGIGLYIRSRERPSPNVRVSGVLDGPNEWLHVLELLERAIAREHPLPS